MAVRKATKQYKELRKEVSRLASMANKRLKRLEKNELTELPAYRAWADNGKIKFSVKGKDYNELQSELWRLRNFLDDRTSTVREANKYLREIASNTGIKYKGLKDLKGQISKFFELTSKIEQYNKSIGETAKALDYQKIWMQVNKAIEIGAIDLRNIKDTNQALDIYLDRLDELIEVEEGKEGFKDDDMSEWDFIEI